MSVLEQGRAGEAWARDWFTTRGVRVFQPDWIAFIDGAYVQVEVKNQERFTPPPFFGHGLPPYQVRDRLEFQAATGVRALLLVHDLTTGEALHQWLDVLDEGPKFYTSGTSPRVIYPISAFEVAT